MFRETEKSREDICEIIDDFGMKRNRKSFGSDDLQKRARYTTDASADHNQEHEKTCQEDDDVIFCGEEYVTNPVDKQLIEQTSFLQNFSLMNPKLMLPNQMKTPMKKSSIEQSTSGTNRRKPRCSQIVLSSNIPFSSPAGQQLIKLSKSCLSEGYSLEKMGRYERYCSAPPLSDETSTNSWPIKPIKYTRVPVTYRRPQDQTYRWYKFPRRQLNHRSWYRQAFLNLNINELKLCKPVTVKLKKMTSSDIEAFHSALRHKSMMENVGGPNVSFDDKSNIVDVIDLCSDDEDSQYSTNGAQHQHDIENVSQTASTPASTISSTFIEPMQTSFDVFTETSSRATMSMFNASGNFEYQNQETHQSFLNGAQGSVMTKIDNLTEISIQKLTSAKQAHISIDLTL
ncbi:hypothetical protein Bhyg_03540 [Pseudolycoriella hygida]|uniref:Uncharacterized protein n=1 Tax=Pseudolycoriella hygida TaxID=35572 RepID=A0A9Q0NEA5_9DIPT|nr:hypothetical protein Bhyg_03540 [Pseudolycoriella hygida]